MGTNAPMQLWAQQTGCFQDMRSIALTSIAPKRGGMPAENASGALGGNPSPHLAYSPMPSRIFFTPFLPIDP